jgi:hypothetical protein
LVTRFDEDNATWGDSNIFSIMYILRMNSLPSYFLTYSPQKGRHTMAETLRQRFCHGLGENTENSRR